MKSKWRSVAREIRAWKGGEGRERAKGGLMRGKWGRKRKSLETK